MEVVDCLRQNARPVNGVDGSEVVCGVELGVGEESFDNVLQEGGLVKVGIYG